MAVLIHELGPDGIGDVHAVWREAGLHFRPDGRDSFEHLIGEVEAGTAFLLGAFDDGRLVGVVLGTHDGRKGWINRLAVLPGARRTRVGLTLISACEEEFRRRGIGIVASLVEGRNEAGNELFQTAGFASHDITYFRKPIEDWEQ